MKRFACITLGLGLVVSCSVPPETAGDDARTEVPVELASAFDPYIGVWETANNGVLRVFVYSETDGLVLGCAIEPDTEGGVASEIVEFRFDEDRIVGRNRLETDTVTFEYTGYPVPGGGELDWDITARSGAQASEIKQTWSQPINGAMTVVNETESDQDELLLWSDEWVLRRDVEPRCD